MPQCQDCTYYKDGFCTAHPPVKIVMGTESSGSIPGYSFGYPPVLPTQESCGEYRHGGGP